MYNPFAKDELTPRLDELMHRLDERLHQFRCGYLVQNTGLNCQVRPHAGHTKEMRP
jgi:hypothetical protein